MADPSQPRYRVGERVFLASAGLGTIVDLAGRDASGKPAPLAPGAEPFFYVVNGDEAVACVAIAAAGETLRPLVSPEVARQMLDELRTLAPPVSPPEPLADRGRKVVHSGSPVEHARYLRELCELPVPLSETFASGLTFFTRLVVPEVAAVLKLDQALLETELRDRFPAARDAWDRTRLRFHP